MDKRENMSLAELRAEKAHLNKKMQALAKELFEAADDDEAKLNKYEELKAEYVAVENLIGAQTDGSTFNGHYHEKTSELSFRGVPVTIIFDIEAGQHHLAEDFAALEKAGIDNLIKTDFIAWLKGDNGTNISDETIFAGLHLYGVNYQYGKIVAQYSPTGEEDNFGQFEFDFDCGNEECRDVFEAVAMQVYVHDGEIVKVSGFDI